jgi:hypothetical protein
MEYVHETCTRTVGVGHEELCLPCRREKASEAASKESTTENDDSSDESEDSGKDGDGSDNDDEEAYVPPGESDSDSSRSAQAPEAKPVRTLAKSPGVTDTKLNPAAPVAPDSIQKYFEKKSLNPSDNQLKSPPESIIPSTAPNKQPSSGPNTTQPSPQKDLRPSWQTQKRKTRSVTAIERSASEASHSGEEIT